MNSTCPPIQVITADNYEETITALSGAVRGAAINEQEQTSSNLGIVTEVFARSAALINITSIDVRDEVSWLLFCCI